MSAPSTNTINLAIAETFIYGVALFPMLYITWKHGKAGMVCWPIVVSFFVMRLVADIYQIINREQPEQPSQVLILTTSGSIACLSLGLIGVVYEANIVLPGTPKRWTEKAILGVTHLVNTAGIGAATYGGSPSPNGGVVSSNLNQIGNCMMLFVMFGVCGWIWPTWKRIMKFQRHQNFEAARFLVLLGGVAMPYQLIRLASGTIYAFSPSEDLDPFTGTFAIRLLISAMQLAAALALMAGGWLSMHIVPLSQLPQRPQRMEEDVSYGIYDDGLETIALTNKKKATEWTSV
ncbi:hypothetical protein PFICI_14987 [Pestalotiopsis fici W106-1]|uniref:DUF7702 domain-containing protein n=1 Tax=Pestalotiopsis fici (strain W106-1 / CGMCC3.15140) TaxID=1229662 RepID=W3WJR7_PESFW|nr:uncharacterized protein PFICI_14987 [Pestalotiopsis fici W106-1]ETS73382.1 hypothetical protein PFICI_14987 [Pestalotiopsis fici W106-1]